MASLQEFLEVLADAYPDEKVRGKEFEPFLRAAPVASPSHQFTNVWLSGRRRSARRGGMVEPVGGPDLRTCLARSEGLEPPTF